MNHSLQATKPGVFNFDTTTFDYSAPDNVGVLTDEAKELLKQYIQERPDMEKFVLSNLQSAREGSYDSYQTLCTIIDPKGTDRMVQSVVAICDQAFAVLSGGQTTSDKHISLPGEKDKIRVFRVNPELGD